MSFETKLEKYARLIVQSGLNVQEKQTVVISASIESYQLVREVTKQAYLVGAKEVVVHYSDEEVTRMKYENMEVEDFNHVPTWFSSFRNDYALMNACFLYVDDENPEMLAGIEPKKISNWQRAVKKACKTYFDLSDNMTNAWCIVGGATQKWANKVYPDMSNQEALDSLWNAIFKAAKIDDEHDPVELWSQHRRSFEKRVNYLNGLNLKKLYYKNSKGTEITIGLNDDYLFAGGGSYLKNGVYNFPNIPTEEIFTSPNKDDVEGIVFSSLPLSYGGNIVDEFYLRFKDGQVIDFGAKEGYEVLKGIIDNEEFVNRFVFDGGQARKTLSSGNEEAEKAIVYLYQINKFDDLINEVDKLVKIKQEHGIGKNTSRSMKVLLGKYQTRENTVLDLKQRLNKASNQLRIKEAKKKNMK